jgi:hypothetical protein
MKGQHLMLLKSDYVTRGLTGKFLKIWPLLVPYLNSIQLPFCPLSEETYKMDRYSRHYYGNEVSLHVLCFSGTPNAWDDVGQMSVHSQPYKNKPHEPKGKSTPFGT